MTIDNHIFYTCSHFLSVSERKSRINSFSISKRFIYLSLLASSYCICVNLLNCRIDGGNSFPVLHGLPFVFVECSLCFLLYLFVKLCICSAEKPNFSPISFLVNPLVFNSNISFSYCCMCL